MDKAILVIDMPTHCGECPVCACYQASAFSSREYWCSTNGKDVESYSKPDWCPLKQLPKKKTGFQYADGYDYADGWNECIDKILET